MQTIVLRAAQRTHFTDPFSAESFDVGAAAAGTARAHGLAPEPTIEVEFVDAHARVELLRDPAVVAVAPSMPTRLIEPFADADGDGGGGEGGDPAG
ncbi:MAG: hypothetical protein WBC33_09180, partial [Conexibacter sp.]